MSNNPTQEQIFNEFIRLKSELDDLAGYVQNDLDRLLNDEYVTIEQIAASLPEISEKFHRLKENIDINTGAMLTYIINILQKRAGRLNNPELTQEQKRD